VKEPEFLTLAEVLDIQRFQIERHGGRQGIRDRGLLESALAVPESSFDGEFLHPSLFAIAAAYAYHIAENQPFIDGNKRAALGAALVFLDMNGIFFDDPKGKLYDAMMAIAARKMTKDDLAGLLERLAKA
jgi:death-on-curing protein